MPDSTPTHHRPPETGARACRQCGTCCRKGGPALHLEDRSLVMEGHIPAEALYTIRTGEPVRDNVAERLTYADADIIKIKGQGGSWCCRWLEKESHRCTIYDRRPIECRALQCWDTREIEALYGRGRLTRQHLLEDVAGLWDLISDHDRRCAYPAIRDHTERLAADPSQQATALGAITEMVKYDQSLRQLLVENGHATQGMLDFLLGRPLIDTLHGFQIKVEQAGGRIRLVQAPGHKPDGRR
ncbi:MAG: YkgJ family cysteine cluster protein [Desulfobacterales bacterium]|jgi:Fe-S-cluster containining protein